MTAEKRSFWSYTYESLKDHVEPDEIKKYTEALDKRDKFSYVLSYSEDNKAISFSSTKKNNRNSRNGIYASLVVLLMIGGIIWWATRN